MFFSDIEFVVALNKAATGEQHKLIARDKLEGALGRATAYAHYESADLIELAAILMQSIAQAHPFLDGNKRTAFVVGLIFLEQNGIEIEIDDTEETARLIEMGMIFSSSRDILIRTLNSRVIRPQKSKP